MTAAVRAMPRAGPTVGDLRHGLFVRDTGRFPEMHDPLRPTADDPVEELSRVGFEAAARAALRDVLRVDVLARKRCAKVAPGIEGPTFQI